MRRAVRGVMNETDEPVEESERRARSVTVHSCVFQVKARVKAAHVTFPRYYLTRALRVFVKARVKADWENPAMVLTRLRRSAAAR